MTDNNKERDIVVLSLRMFIGLLIFKENYKELDFNNDDIEKYLEFDKMDFEMMEMEQ